MIILIFSILHKSFKSAMIKSLLIFITIFISILFNMKLMCICVFWLYKFTLLRQINRYMLLLMIILWNGCKFSNLSYPIIRSTHIFQIILIISLHLFCSISIIIPISFSIILNRCGNIIRLILQIIRSLSITIIICYSRSTNL
jgi:hypothetical protein